jgi:putative transposase
MKRRARTRTKRQGPRPAIPTPSMEEQMSRVLLPLRLGILQTKENAYEFVLRNGIEAMREAFEHDVMAIVGPAKLHQPGRESYRWGKTRSTIPLGGRMVSVPRPRVRTADGTGEIPLPTLEAFQRRDSLPERVVNQILLGVSTRGYSESLEKAPKDVPSRGASKSAASRRLVARTRDRLQQLLTRRLDDFDVIAVTIDGIEIAGQAVVVALGIDRRGKKQVLGLRQGSTENGPLCTELLQEVLERGLKLRQRVLFVVDGGKGIRKAITDVFGDLAVVQRCQIHKMRNIKGHLSPSRHAYVMREMRDAYKSSSAAVARRKLRALIGWLERNGEEGAAASVREGLEETLTVLKLEVPAILRRFFATTNVIENLMGTIRTVTRNVKRWQPRMKLRWTALALTRAEQRFHGIKGHRHLPQLAAALGDLATCTEEAA